MILSSTELIYAGDNVWAAAIELIADIQIVFPLLYGFLEIRKQYQYQTQLLGLSVLSMVVMFCLVPLASPDPFIDVFVVTNHAIDSLFSGINPYNTEYPDIYQGALGYSPDFVYWPGLLYPMILIKKILHLDVRYTQILSILAAILLLTGFDFSHSNSTSKQLRNSLMFLMMPIAFFVLEQAWLDSIMFPFIVLLFEGIKCKSNAMTGLSLGYLAASRQTNLLLIILVLSYLWRHFKSRSLIKVIGYAGLMFGVLMLPFWLWDFPAFLQTTVLQVLQYRPSTDSLSWSAYLWAYHQFLLNSSLLLVLALLMSLILGYRAKTIAQLTFGTLLTYFFFFLTLKQAYCNYYYYLSFYLFLFLYYTSSKNKDISVSLSRFSTEQPKTS
ncbi:MAG: hypothetical protein F6J87_20080 [Spirulina sp. SIO3F2]|nr:hypothetical protein [Spirulina sp. SIO3F2]